MSSTIALPANVGFETERMVRAVCVEVFHKPEAKARAPGDLAFTLDMIAREADLLDAESDSSYLSRMIDVDLRRLIGGTAAVDALLGRALASVTARQFDDAVTYAQQARAAAVG